MSFRILRKGSDNYKEKLRNLRDIQIKLDTKRWAAITQRTDAEKIANKIIADDFSMTSDEKEILLAELKDTIERESLDIRLVQGNMQIDPALKLLDQKAS